jgi:hypothetical protein
MIQSQWMIYLLIILMSASVVLSLILCYFFYGSVRRATDSPNSPDLHEQIAKLEISISSLEAAIISLKANVQNAKDDASLDNSIKDSVRDNLSNATKQINERLSEQLVILRSTKDSLRDNISNAMKQLNEQFLERLLKTSSGSLQNELTQAIHSAFEASMKHFDQHVRPSLISDLENSLSNAIARLPPVPDMEKRIELVLLEKLIPSFPREIDNLMNNATEVFSKNITYILRREIEDLPYRRGWPSVSPLDRTEWDRVSYLARTDWERVSYLTTRGDYDDPWLRQFAGRCRSCGGIVLLPR